MPSPEAIQRAIDSLGGETAEADSPADPAPVSPAPKTDSTGESAPADGGAVGDNAAKPSPGAADPASEERKTKHALLEEKLAHVRERRAADRIEKKARETAAKAEQDAKVAAEERGKWESLKSGTFFEGIKAQGRDPKAVFEEMKQEAIKASTPEAQIERMQALFDKQLREAVEPLQKRVDELTEREKELLEREESTTFRADFTAEVQADAYKSLRIEYGDDRLFRIADGLKKNPAQLRAYARELKVKLTYDDERFTMQDILGVLRRAQDSHEEEKQRRAGQFAPPQAQATPAAVEKTVNGTVQPAANPLGNAPASSRATNEAAKPRLTRAQRVQKLADGDG